MWQGHAALSTENLYLRKLSGGLQTAPNCLAWSLSDKRMRTTAFGQTVSRCPVRVPHAAYDPHKAGECAHCRSRSRLHASFLFALIMGLDFPFSAVGGLQGQHNKACRQYSSRLCMPCLSRHVSSRVDSGSRGSDDAGV